MKEGILSVSELPMLTTSSEIFRVLNGLIEEKGLEWKNCVRVCTDHQNLLFHSEVHCLYHG